jgi:excisionase family DNA binding protein
MRKVVSYPWRHLETLADESPKLETAVHRPFDESVQPSPAEMTPAQAAEFLDVAPLLVVKLLRRKELPCRLVGKRRRIPIGALVEYREKMYQRAKEAADDIVRMSQEAGLYEQEIPPRKEQ